MKATPASASASREVRARRALRASRDRGGAATWTRPPARSRRGPSCGRPSPSARPCGTRRPRPPRRSRRRSARPRAGCGPAARPRCAAPARARDASGFAGCRAREPVPHERERRREQRRTRRRRSRRPPVSAPRADANDSAAGQRGAERQRPRAPARPASGARLRARRPPAARAGSCARSARSASRTLSSRGHGPRPRRPRPARPDVSARRSWPSPTASTQTVRRPSSTSQAYTTAPSRPTSAPSAASTSPSVMSWRRTRASRQPTARSRPISRERCSTPSRNKSPASSRAATIRNTLNARKYWPKSPAPCAACRACARTGSSARPACAGSRRGRSAASKAARADSRSPPAAGASADRRGGAQAMAPQGLPGGERQERLGRRAMVVPVLLVLRTHAREVEGERRIPVGEVRGVGDARILRREVAVGGGAGQGHDRFERKRGLARLEAPLLLPHQVRRASRGPRRARPARARPTRSAPGRSRRPACRRSARASSGATRAHQRVGHAAVADADVVREVGQHRLRAEAGGGRGACAAARATSSETKPDALSSESTPWGAQRSQAQAQVPEGQRLARGRPRVAGSVADQDRVGAAGLRERALQQAQGHEHGAHRLLARVQRELAERARAPSTGPRIDAQRASAVLLAAEQRGGRDVRRLLDAEQQRRALAAASSAASASRRARPAVRGRAARARRGTPRSARPRRTP